MRVPFIIPDGGGFVKLDAGWIFRYHGPDDEVMTMQYLCAPMEGVTGDLFRQAQRQTFPAADSYYTPFLSPTANRTFSPRELREIEPAHNAGIRVVPHPNIPKRRLASESLKISSGCSHCSARIFPVSLSTETT